MTGLSPRDIESGGKNLAVSDFLAIRELGRKQWMAANCLLPGQDPENGGFKENLAIGQEMGIWVGSFLKDVLERDINVGFATFQGHDPMSDVPTVLNEMHGGVDGDLMLMEERVGFYLNGDDLGDKNVAKLRGLGIQVLDYTVQTAPQLGTDHYYVSVPLNLFITEEEVVDGEEVVNIVRAVKDASEIG